MKMLILLVATFVSVVADTSEAVPQDCISYLSENTSFSAQAISSICYDATVDTSRVLYWSLLRGFQKSDSLALLAGAATAWTGPCLEHMINYFKESFSLAMICRGISQDSYRTLVNPANERLIRTYATTVALLFARSSFTSFTHAFRRLKGFDYCSQFICN